MEQIGTHGSHETQRRHGDQPLAEADQGMHAEHGR